MLKHFPQNRDHYYLKIYIFLDPFLCNFCDQNLWIRTSKKKSCLQYIQTKTLLVDVSVLAEDNLAGNSKLSLRLVKVIELRV